MRSTGEVLGIAETFGLAYWKSQEAVTALPTHGTVLMTVAERDRSEVVAEVARRFAGLGFRIRATAGTRAFLAARGVVADHILKQHEGRPSIADAIKNGDIQLIVNTPAGKISEHDDSYLRKLAIRHRVPYLTALTAAMAAASGIEAYRTSGTGVRSLQSYHSSLR
jgi:carbamoyl-phosphate synthase large subunit